MMFAGKVTKFNSIGWKQERTFVITTENIYNIKKDKIKRRIRIVNLSGLSKSNLGAKNEFTLHVKQDYDYRFITDRRSEIIELIKHRFAEKTFENLPIFGIEKSNLYDFTTLEKDFKKGISKYPPSHFRLACENLLVTDEPDKVSVYVAKNVSQEDL